MMKPYLAAAGVIAVVASFLVPTVVARQQTATQFEYATVVLYEAATRIAPNMSDRKVLESGYRFCAAVAADWACRDFAATGLTPHEIRGAWTTTLSTLGNESWELVTVLYDQEATLTDTYIFKRQRR